MPVKAQPSSSDNKVYVHPGLFKEEDCPIIVLVDDLRGWLGWAIKSHTAGNYSHAMTLTKPGILASQGWLFETKGIDQYLKPSIMMKFWRIKNLTDPEKLTIETAIFKRLRLPWWRRRYDFLGIVGQFFMVKWIQSPFAKFCSEEINDDYLKSVPRTANLMKEPNPSELDNVFKASPKIMECLGYWWDS